MSVSGGLFCLYGTCFIGSVPLPPRALLATLHRRVIDFTSLCVTGLPSLQTACRMICFRSTKWRRRGSFSDSSRRASSGGAGVLQLRNNKVMLCMCTFLPFKIVPPELHFKALFYRFGSISLPRFLSKSTPTCSDGLRRSPTVCNHVGPLSHSMEITHFTSRKASVISVYCSSAHPTTQPAVINNE